MGEPSEFAHADLAERVLALELLVRLLLQERDPSADVFALSFVGKQDVHVPLTVAPEARPRVEKEARDYARRMLRR